ncbi:carbon starvation protein A, partial [Streptomyces sp. NPDC048845]
IDDGKVLAPAKNMDDMHTVVTNCTVDGVLSALFAVLIILVLADATRVCVKAIRNPAETRLDEAPYVESRYVAPAELWPTAEEKAELAEAGLGSEGGLRKESAGAGSSS